MLYTDLEKSPVETESSPLRFTVELWWSGLGNLVDTGAV